MSVAGDAINWILRKAFRESINGESGALIEIVGARSELGQRLIAKDLSIAETRHNERMADIDKRRIDWDNEWLGG